MRTAIGLVQYFALFSWLLSLLVSLEQCRSTPPQLVSCEVVSCGRVVDTTVDSITQHKAGIMTGHKGERKQNHQSSSALVTGGNQKRNPGRTQLACHRTAHIGHGQRVQ